jgi:hypothetical protein
LLATDFMRMRLSDEKALPLNEGGILSADDKVIEFLLTPVVGYQVVDKEEIKVDATAGFRFWHLEQTLEFKPSLLGVCLNRRTGSTPLEEPGSTFPCRRFRILPSSSP